MNRNHYIHTATTAELRAALELANGEEARKSVERIIEGLANIYAAEDARFEKVKFMRNCGMIV